jgi:hypothetical protein
MKQLLVILVLLLAVLSSATLFAQNGNAVYLPVALHVPPPPFADPIANGDFEAGPQDWSESSSNGYDLVLLAANYPDSAPPHSGAWLAWLGGDDNELSVIEQSFQMPVEATYLEFYNWLGSQEGSCNFDYMRVELEGASFNDEIHFQQLCDPLDTNGWQKVSLAVDSYAGENVTLRFLVQTDGSLNSNAFIDDVAIVDTAAVNRTQTSAEGRGESWTGVGDGER